MSDKLFPDATAPVIDETKNYLEDLVGEGKKYKDPEALAKAALHKDLHISHLEVENKTFRDELKVRTTLEEFLAQMKSQENPNTRETNPEEKPEALNKQDIEAFLETKLAERDNTVRTSQNLGTVQDELKRVWGDTWQVELRRRTRDLSVGEDFMTELASRQPQAFLKLLEVDSKKTEPSLQSRTTGSPQDSTVKNNRYYQKMMIDKPREFWKPDVQHEIFEQAKLQGDAFFA